jgi:hypothetical protein
MPEPSHGDHELDLRLAEIDRKLRAIQADLLPERERRMSPEPATRLQPPASEQAPAGPETRASPEPPAGPETRAGPEPPAAPPAPEKHTKLLAAMRELLGAYGLTLEALSSDRPER